MHQQLTKMLVDEKDSRGMGIVQELHQRTTKGRIAFTSISVSSGIVPHIPFVTRYGIYERRCTMKDTKTAVDVTRHFLFFKRTTQNVESSI